MIRVFTDTAANLPPEVLEKYHIRTLPLTYRVDGELPEGVSELAAAVAASKAKIAELEEQKTAVKSESAVEAEGAVVEPAAKVCPVCGAESDSKFCPKCGAPMD